MFSKFIKNLQPSSKPALKPVKIKGELKKVVQKPEPKKNIKSKEERDKEKEEKRKRKQEEREIKKKLKQQEKGTSLLLIDFKYLYYIIKVTMMLLSSF